MNNFEKRLTDIIMRNVGNSELSEKDKKDIDDLAKDVAFAGFEHVLKSYKKSA
jgi:hypothetical protein